MQPNGAALRNVGARFGEHTQLRAVLCLNHIIPAPAEEDLPHHRRRHDVLALLLRGRNGDVMRADGNRRRRPRIDFLAVTAQWGAREIDSGGIETLAFDDVTRPDKTRDEFRSRTIVDLFRATRLFD